MSSSGHSDRSAAQRQLGAALRALQHRSGHTLRELEKRVPVSDSSLSRYFRGDAVAPWSVVVQICRALGGDPSELRALWETAERTLPHQPPDAVDGLRSAAAVPAWRRLARRTVQARPSVRIVSAVVASALIGAGLALYGVQFAAAPTGQNALTAAAGLRPPYSTAAGHHSVFYEAEKARIDQVVIRDADGARSGKAIARMDYRDSYVEFAVFATSVGPRSMTVRFSNGSQDSGGKPTSASHSLSINGAVANPVHYPHTGWENWQKTEPVTVFLHEGHNKIRFSKGDVYTELDGIELT